MSKGFRLKYENYLISKIGNKEKHSLYTCHITSNKYCKYQVFLRKKSVSYIHKK